MKPQLRFKEFTDDWEEKRLGEIAEINPKNNRDIPLLFEYIDLESVEKGKLIKKEIISKEVAPSRAKRIVKKFDILYQTVRPYQRNNFIELRNKDDVIASTGYALIRLKKDNPLFFYQQLNTDIFTNKILVRCTGTSYPAINSLDLRYIKIQFPSLEEQEKIGKFFSLLDQRIEKQERKVALLEKAKKGYMQKIFKQELRFKDEKGKDYPAWEEKKLGGITKIKTGNADLQDKNKNGKYPFFVRSAQVERINTYDYDGEAILIPGDGKIGDVYHYINGKFNYHQRVYKISDFDINIMGKYIYYYMIFYFKKEAMKNSVKATVDSLRLPTIQNFKIQLPVLVEQKKLRSF